jgi:lipopolysaccharide export system protein LptA
MTKWQRTARLLTAIAALAVVLAVALTIKRRAPQRVEEPVARTDPAALVESAGGRTFRINREHEEIRIEYERLLTYANNSSKMLGVKVTTERASGRLFTIVGKEGQVGERDSTILVSGDVVITASDGMVIKTDQATYAESDSVVRVPGPLEFARGRIKGTGIGATFDKVRNVLAIGSRATVHVDEGPDGQAAMDIEAGALEFRRDEKIILLAGNVKVIRPQQTIEADNGVAHLTADEDHVEKVELRGQSRMVASGETVGGLRGLNSRDLDLFYGPDGQTLEHAVLSGNGLVQVAGDVGQPAREISAEAIDVMLAGENAVPTALTAKERVKLTIPAEPGGVGRTIAAQALDGQGDATHGLTSARFTGNVQFSEHGPGVDRAGRSATLDAALAPGFSSIEVAQFGRAVRFVDGPMTATAAAARYVLAAGTLALSGSDAANPRPHVVNESIDVDAPRIDVTLGGPIVKAGGGVKSVLVQKRAGPGEAGRGSELRMPSMLKPDQPVNVTADDLNYDGATSLADYKGKAQLWQGDTTIKAPALSIDGKSGNLAASGTVTTTMMLSQTDKDGKKDRVRSIGTSQTFNYEDEIRRATYTGEAHLTGPQGDMTAPKIELYLKPSGDELDRAEGYDGVTLKAEHRTTTGTRMTYFDVDERYLVTGIPVTIVDECGRKTLGRTATFFKAADRVVVDGNEQVRTQTTGKSSCPGS